MGRVSGLSQIAAFVVAGLAAAAAHYGTLIALVEGEGWSPLQATLCGYIAGGIVSYVVNRRFTFRSSRRHSEGIWRFVVVAGVGFGLTALLMDVLVRRLSLPYLPAQVATTGCVLVWSFVAHKVWTFGEVAPP